MKPSCRDIEGLSTEIPSLCQQVPSEWSWRWEGQPAQLVAAVLAHGLFRPSFEARGANDRDREKDTSMWPPCKVPARYLYLFPICLHHPCSPPFAHKWTGDG